MTGRTEVIRVTFEQNRIKMKMENLCRSEKSCMHRHWWSELHGCLVGQQCAVVIWSTICIDLNSLICIFIVFLSFFSFFFFFFSIGSPNYINACLDRNVCCGLVHHQYRSELSYLHLSWWPELCNCLFGQECVVVVWSTISIDQKSLISIFIGDLNYINCFFG